MEILTQNEIDVLNLLKKHNHIDYIVDVISKDNWELLKDWSMKYDLSFSDSFYNDIDTLNIINEDVNDILTNIFNKIFKSYLDELDKNK